MTESVEMYLVMTALLRSDASHPVPVSLLANKLSVSAVSANEMCRKLSERGLVAYQPYKGVTLTETGEAMAQEILSRRRLWVIFLVENLGIEPQEADALACQLEHITSERLVTALKAFLEQAPAAVRGSVAAGLRDDPDAAQPLTACTAGTRGQIAAITAEPVVRGFLHAQGVLPDALAEVLSVGADGAVLLSLVDHQVAVAPSVAKHILLAPLAAPPAARHRTWECCSAFWDCMRGEATVCGCNLQPAPHNG